MRDVGHHLLRALVLQRLRGDTERAGGIHHVIDEHTGLALHIADDVHHLRLIRPRAPLVDDRQVRVVEALRESPRAHHAADIRRHHDHVPVRLFPGITQQHR